MAIYRHVGTCRDRAESLRSCLALQERSNRGGTIHYERALSPRLLAGRLCALLAFGLACGSCDRDVTRAAATGDHPPLYPIIELGREDGGPQEFTRIAGAVRLPGGRIVVADGGTNELRIFSEHGDHLATFGRRGGGPGEFYGLWWVGVSPPDTILAYDRQSRRLSLFTSDGRFVRGLPLDAHLGWSGAVVGRFADGTLMLASSTLPAPRVRREGPVRDSIELSRYDPRTGTVATIARLPDRDLFTTGAGAAAVVFGVPLRRSLHVVACDSTILAAFSDSARAWHLAMNGRVLGELRFPVQIRPVSAAAREQMAQSRIAQASPDFRPRIAAALASAAAIPTTRPAFDRLAGDSSGLLWIGMSPDDADSPSSWLRLTPGGSVVDTVYLAPRARIVSVSGDRLLVVRRDDDAVEHLVVYRIPPVAARAEVPVSTAPRNAGCYRSFFEIER